MGASTAVSAGPDLNLEAAVRALGPASVAGLSPSPRVGRGSEQPRARGGEHIPAPTPGRNPTDPTLAEGLQRFGSGSLSGIAQALGDRNLTEAGSELSAGRGTYPLSATGEMGDGGVSQIGGIRGRESSGQVEAERERERGDNSPDRRVSYAWTGVSEPTGGRYRLEDAIESALDGASDGGRSGLSDRGEVLGHAVASADGMEEEEEEEDHTGHAQGRRGRQPADSRAGSDAGSGVDVDVDMGVDVDVDVDVAVLGAGSEGGHPGPDNGLANQLSMHIRRHNRGGAGSSGMLAADTAQSEGEEEQGDDEDDEDGAEGASAAEVASIAAASLRSGALATHAWASSSSLRDAAMAMEGASRGEEDRPAGSHPHREHEATARARHRKAPRRRALTGGGASSTAAGQTPATARGGGGQVRRGKRARLLRAGMGARPTGMGGSVRLEGRARLAGGRGARQGKERAGYQRGFR